jgi:serine/threonine-protein kinase
MTSDAFEQDALRGLSDALDQPSDTRDTWITERFADTPELRDRILKLLHADQRAPAAIQTGGASRQLQSAPMPERVGAYKIVDLIGQGGMGAVYKAERDQGDFDHVAAIKIVRPGVLSEELSQRFERERQILATLNHRNIARLYDGGQMPDGAPYLVMEFVDGAPILDWAQNNKLGTDARLKAFISLCAAAQCAHQSLIIHRDITPANVLVTETGEVKLIDFGIALPQPEDMIAPDPASAIDSEHSLSYTPGFAAPERAHGRAANVASDIFSLGKVLGALVSAAHQDADLNAIVGKATARDPDVRYGSVDALADDVSRYLSGFAVNARDGNATYRLGKFIKRRRLSVAAAVVAFLTLGAGLAVMTGLYQTAERERLAADQRYQQVRSLATFMMFDLYDELERVGGNTKSISLLAEESQKYLTSLSLDDRAALDVRLETVVGLKRLADISGNPKNQNLGDRFKAGELLNQALETAETLYLDHPEHPDVIRALGEVAFSTATHTYVSTDQNQRAHDLAGRSVQMYQTLIQNGAANFDDQRQLLRAKLMTAVPLPWMGRGEDGVEILRETRGLAANLLAAYPEEIQAVNLLGSLNVELARALTRLGDNNEQTLETLPFWNEAVALRLQAYEMDPDTIYPYRSLVTIYYERGAAHRAEGNMQAALDDTLRSENIAEELLARDPDDAWLKRMLNGIREEKIKTLSYAERHDEVLALIPEALLRARAEYDANPENAGVMREWGFTLVLLSNAALRAGDRDTGCPIVSDARQAWTNLEAKYQVSEIDKTVSLELLARLERDCAS